MKDSVEFEDDEKNESASNWQMGGVSQASLDTDASRILNQQNLQLFHKKDTLSQRTVIPATLLEKLAYYRAFVSSPCKTNIISVQQIRFNRFLWRYIFNVVGKSLPSTYVYTFLGMYAPDEHFFIPKMIPICYGCVLSSICSSFFGLMIYTQALVISWDYVFHGLIYKNPWNRCALSEHVSTHATLTCYNLTEFTRKIQNKTTIFEEFGYKIDSEPEKMFQMAPILYLKYSICKFVKNVRRWRMKEILIPYTLCACEGAMVVAAALLYQQLFKRYIWMILNYSQWALNLIYLATFTHLVIYYFNTGFHKIEIPIDEITHEIWDADIAMLAESMTGPPIVHILTARGTEKVRPSRHSSVIIASNAIYYIFRGLLSYMMKRYCENIVGVSVKITDMNPFSFYFFWPIYFSTFYLGDFYSITFFLLNAIMEFIVTVITLTCLVEAITQEWHFMKPWFICCIITLLTCIVSFLSGLNFRVIMYIFCTSTATLAEAIALFYLYPLGRLMDDVAFHYGTAPTSLRALSLRIVPIFYAIKVYTMLGVIIKILKEDLTYQVEVLYAQIIPFLLGGLFSIIKIVYRNRQGWKQLFVPVPEWGPKDFTERQLRKQFDSRQYIDSQASRDLSRYLIAKADLKTYKLDIQYDKASHHSKTQSEFLVEEEEKDS